MPLKSQAIYQAWVRAVNNHDFKEADQLYLKLLTLEPLLRGINFPMGVWYQEKSLWTEAERAFLRALKTDPEIHGDTYYYLGNVAREQKEYQKAINYYREGLKAEPQFFEYHYNLGKIYALLGQNQKALEQFTKACEINPEDLDTYINIGVELSNLGHSQDALKAYKKALKLNPNSYLVYSNIGVEYTALKKYEKAIIYHKKALAINAFYGNGWYNLACTYARANEPEKSLKALKRAVRLDKENIEYAKKDSELDNIKNTPGYKSIIDKTT